MEVGIRRNSFLQEGEKGNLLPVAAKESLHFARSKLHLDKGSKAEEKVLVCTESSVPQKRIREKFNREKRHVGGGTES